jgi:hypothetical protein
MSAEESEREEEPIERNCSRCDECGYLKEMIDCPRCEEDMEEKGVAPGWLHRECCEDIFLEDPKGCGECCQNTEFGDNVRKHFEACVNLQKLNKSTTKQGIEIFKPEEDSYIITAQMDKLIEPLKPVNVVAETFLDLDAELLYVKDNQKNIIEYPLSVFREVKERFSELSGYEPELFYSTSKGFLFIVYHIGDVFYGGVISGPSVEETENTRKDGLYIALKAKEKYYQAERFFDVKVSPNREELKIKIQSLSEDDLIKVVLVPTLCAQGFKGVKPVSFHGPGEKGGDFSPFYKIEEFGKIIYYSAQVKAVKIHAKSAKHEGNVNELINQMDELFRTSFNSLTGNAQTRITRAFIFLSQQIAPDARDQLFYKYENRQVVTIVEIDDVVTAVIDAGIADQIVNYVNTKETS